MKDWRIEIRIEIRISGVVIDNAADDLYRLDSKTEFQLMSIYERHSVYENRTMYLNRLIGKENDKIELRTHRWSLPYFINEKDKKNENKFYILRN